MDEGPARDAAARAGEAARQAGKQLGRVQAEVGEEDRGIGAEEDRIQRSQGQQDQQLAELAHLVPGLDLQKPDEELLAPLVARGKELKEQVDEAKERALEVNTSKTTAESEAGKKSAAVGAGVAMGACVGITATTSVGVMSSGLVVGRVCWKAKKATS